MGGGSGVEVHWPNLIDSNLCAISGGYGSGPQMQMGGSFVDDYSLAMAAPAALWSGGMAPSAAPVSASVCAPAGAQGTGLSAGLVNFTSSQLHFGSGFGFGLGSGGSLNMPGMNMSMSMAQSGNMGLVSPEPTLFEMVNAVPQSLRALGPGFGAGGMLDMAGAMQQQQQQQPLDSPGLGLGSGCSAAAGAFALQPELEAAELVGVAGNGDLHALPPMPPLLGGGLGDDAAASLLNMAVNVALPMPMPLQQGPGLGEGSNDGLFGLPAGMSMPMEAGVSGSGAGGSFMDLAARFQLNSFSDLADLSAITSQPLNYILQQDPGAGMQPMVSAVGPRIGGVPDNIPAPAPPPPPPPLRFADLNVTSIPYDSRYRQPYGASVPPGLLFLKPESKLDHGFPGSSPLHAGGGIGRGVGVGGLGLGLGGGVLPGGSLVLDGARSELINISKMTPQEILDAKALAASKSHSEAERRRRERINTHLGTLRTMLPSSTKTDKASLLGEVIEHVKELKRQAADIDGPVPTEVDELGVEMSEASEKHPGKLIIKLTVCCDDRPGLLTAIGRAVEACKLDNFSVELSTLAGRLKVVMLAACTESVQEAKQDAVMSSLQEAVRAALDKVGPATAAATSTRTNSSGSSGGLKRQRTGMEASSPSN